LQKRGLKICATLVLLLAGIFAGSHAGRLLVLTVPSKQPDAIVSLASHEWERLPEVVMLAHDYPDAAVWLTVPIHVTAQNCHRCGERQDVLRRAGVEANRIHVLPDRVSNTRDEAAACLNYVRQSRSSEIVIVTSPYHTRRALATFRQVFGNQQVHIGVRPASRSSPARPPRWWLHGYDRAYVAYEWAAIIYYAAKFGIYPWSA
jgi:uncharacterized SAM-binding protein YcdF (DUF218 family)